MAGHLGLCMKSLHTIQIILSLPRATDMKGRNCTIGSSKAKYEKDADNELWEDQWLSTNLDSLTTTLVERHEATMTKNTFYDCDTIHLWFSQPLGESCAMAKYIPIYIYTH